MHDQALCHFSQQLGILRADRLPETTDPAELQDFDIATMMPLQIRQLTSMLLISNVPDIRSA